MMMNKLCIQPKTQFCASNKKATTPSKTNLISTKETEQQSALNQIQAKTAQNWGVSISEQTTNPSLFRQNLQMAFYEQYFQWLADSLIEIDMEYRTRGYLNECIGDVNMTEDDFCSGDGLLHYGLPDEYLGEVNFKEALGYKKDDDTEWNEDYKNCLKKVAKKLGMAQAEPTEFEVFAKMEVMQPKELKQCFKKSKKKI